MTQPPTAVRIGDRVTVTYDPWPVSCNRRGVAEVVYLSRNGYTLRFHFYDAKQHAKWGEVTFTADGRAQGWPTLSWVPGVVAVEHLKSDLIRAVTTGLANLPPDIPSDCRHEILRALIDAAEAAIHRLPPPGKPSTPRNSR